MNILYPFGNRLCLIHINTETGFTSEGFPAQFQKNALVFEVIHLAPWSY
jgi:hypothetical protein